MAAQEIQYQATDPPLPPPPEAQLPRDKPLGPLENLARTADFWSRTLTIYAGYKACQVGAGGWLVVRMRTRWMQEPWCAAWSDRLGSACRLLSLPGAATLGTLNAESQRAYSAVHAAFNGSDVLLCRRTRCCCGRRGGARIGSSTSTGRRRCGVPSYGLVCCPCSQVLAAVAAGFAPPRSSGRQLGRCAAAYGRRAAADASVSVPARLQHQKAAEQMYKLCIDLRGFYLKVCVPCCWALAGCDQLA